MSWWHWAQCRSTLGGLAHGLPGDPPMLHSWEQPGASASSSRVPPPPLTPVGGWSWDPGSGDEGDIVQDVTRDEASRELGNMIVAMSLDRRITARDACVLSYWAKKAGVEGLCETLAMKPGCQSGVYQRHLDRALLIDEEA
eukprot:4647692-Alexandrium_andersonii.AAC.1